MVVIIIWNMRKCRLIHDCCAYSSMITSEGIYSIIYIIYNTLRKAYWNNLRQSHLCGCQNHSCLPCAYLLHWYNRLTKITEFYPKVTQHILNNGVSEAINLGAETIKNQFRIQPHLLLLNFFVHMVFHQQWYWHSVYCSIWKSASWKGLTYYSSEMLL